VSGRREHKPASASLLACVAFAVGAAVLARPAAFAAASGNSLVVCADPDNLPFSNRAGEGFENKIAALLAKDLNATLAYTWWPQQRGYVRKTLNDDKCDVWLGIATGVDRVAASQPYYRSTYVFVTRADAPLQGLTLDDERLRSRLIGVQLIGNDAMNTPPAHAIAARGLTENVRGYMVYGNHAQPHRTVPIIDAVVDKKIDVAIVWGPLAGYFAGQSSAVLRLEPVTPAADPRWPMQYDISMGVRHGNAALLQEVDRVIAAEAPRIEEILTAYHVPPAVTVSPGRIEPTGLLPRVGAQGLTP
jgi:mxaJ protein